MWILRNTVRHYDWGSTTLLPEFLGEAPDGRPWAEMWCGAHPMDPSQVESDGTVERLDDFLAANPSVLGEPIERRFGAQLPFLVKLLAAGTALSLQVHPSAEQARAGFADEEERGVPAQASDRRYKDPYPKPEVLVALTEFCALSGFRDPEDLLTELHGCEATGAAELRTQLTAAVSDGYSSYVEWVLTHGAEVCDVKALVAHLAAVDSTDDSPTSWLPGIAKDFSGDPGILVAWALRATTLAPGEALFTDAGVVHSYVSGLGLEVMAASDNVVRAGLTSKHVDIPELLALMNVRPTPPAIVKPQHDHYPTDAEYFDVRVVDAAGEAHFTAEAATIVLALGEPVKVSSDEESHTLAAGNAVLCPAGERDYRLQGSGHVAVISVP